MNNMNVWQIAKENTLRSKIYQDEIKGFISSDATKFFDKHIMYKVLLFLDPPYPHWDDHDKIQCINMCYWTSGL